MKFFEPSNLRVVDESFDAIDIIRQRSNSAECDTDDDPLYICDISDVINKYYIWKKQMPRVRSFYAVKCNDSSIVIKTLANLGIGFDCASKGEIAKVMSFGVAPQSIIFANPTKPISHIKYAAEMSVSVMTVDSHFELHKIKEHYPDANLVVRIRYDAKIAQLILGNKFGCDPDTGAKEIIKLAKSLGLNMIGVSFHVGCVCMDPPVYEKAIYASRQLFDFAKSIGYKFTLLDIGGGFTGNKGTNINEIASIVNQSIDLHFPSPDVTIIAEPGQFYVASAYTLACKVHSKREIKKNGNFESVMYFINDGVFGSFLINEYEHKSAHPMTFKSTNEEIFKSSVWGPTLDSTDRICEKVFLPRLNIGDFMVFENMGAYSISLAGTFNGFPLPKVEYYIQHKHLHLIDAKDAFYCKAETHRKYLEHQQITRNESNLTKR